jgi:hypothetical protein
MPRLLCLCLAVLLPAAALAGDASVDIGKIEGSYRRRFQNSDSGGNRFMSTDTLDLLRLDNDTAHFAVGLTFYNDHSCGLSGVAEAEKGALVYRNDERGPDEICELHIKAERGRVALSDIGGHCRYSCGARGGYNGAEFATARRRALSRKDRAKLLEEAKGDIAAFAARKGKAGSKP